MKILRLIFSKYFLSVLLLLIQIAALVLIAIIFNDFFPLVNIAVRILGVIVFVIIVNRKQSPEYKLPWIFLVLAFPVFGLLCFIMFGNQRLRPTESRVIHLTEERLNPYFEKSEEEQKELENYLGERIGYENHLLEASGTRGFLHNDITYYEVGEKLWHDLLEELSRAKKFIMMEYFIVDKGLMWDKIHEILKEKAKEGVEIFFMYDDVGCMTMLPSGYYKKLRKEGIKCYKFNKLLPFINGIYNNRDHRKITVIDGLVGFTGGVNLGDEYINVDHRLGHWKDTGLRIKGPAVNNLTKLFLETYSMNANLIIDPDLYINENPIKYENEGYINIFGDGPKPFYDQQVGENNFLNMITSAKKYVYITTPYLIIDNNVTTALKLAAEKGVDVRIITPHIPDKKMVFAMTRSNYKYLRESGVKIYEYTPGFIHAKTAICDDEIAFVGTINLDYRSLTHHFECGAMLVKVPCIEDIKKDFAHIFDVSMLVDDNNVKINWFRKLLAKFLKIFDVLL